MLGGHLHGAGSPLQSAHVESGDPPPQTPPHPPLLKVEVWCPSPKEATGEPRLPSPAPLAPSRSPPPPAPPPPCTCTCAAPPRSPHCSPLHNNPRRHWSSSLHCHSQSRWGILVRARVSNHLARYLTRRDIDEMFSNIFFTSELRPMNCWKYYSPHFHQYGKN